ncbi:MAG TPA: hypothetical protein DER56_04215 [Thermosipho africanus]|nr:hypothetical protein [Thermosipho africanus]
MFKLSSIHFIGFCLFSISCFSNISTFAAGILYLQSPLIEFLK